ncbi:unnamed protein product [Clonostachys chloroleuca]|uniref:Uncharacterized protein n=1 Tax=Clonostachys chloroleuca TaxID=1926264 RepID=A0AA35MAX4_9HYPO|nr:unnamed protein product [Clonostachys chloroleuca]
MKFSIATFFLATTGFVNAFPAADDAAAPRSSCGNQAGRVTCSESHVARERTMYRSDRYPHILVCVSKKWKIQASYAKGTSCNGNDQKNHARCEAY